METELEDPQRILAVTAEQQGASASLSLAEQSFALSVRNWLNGRNSPALKEAELISLQSAMKIVESAEPAKNQIDIPLVPHLTVLGLNRELRQFSYSMLGNEMIRRPVAASHRLLAKILGEGGLEFKVNESAVKNSAVLELLGNLRSLLPEVNIELRGKWSINSGLDSPEYFLRISVNDDKQKQDGQLNFTFGKELAYALQSPKTSVPAGLRETAGLVKRGIITGSKIALEIGLFIALPIAAPSYFLREDTEDGVRNGIIKPLAAALWVGIGNASLMINHDFIFSQPAFKLLLATNVISGIYELVRAGFKKAANKGQAIE